MSSPRRRSIMGPPAPESPPPLAALAIPLPGPNLHHESSVSATTASNTSRPVSSGSPSTSIPTSPTLGNKALPFSSSSPSKSVLSPDKVTPAAPRISPSSSLRRKASSRLGPPSDAPPAAPKPSWPPHSAAQDRISADPGLVLRNARLLLAQAAAAAAAEDDNAPEDNARVLTVDYTSTHRYLFHKRALFPNTPMLHPAEHDRKPKKPVQQKKKTGRLSGQNRVAEALAAQNSAADASTQNSATDVSVMDSAAEDLTRGTTPEISMQDAVAEVSTLFGVATQSVSPEVPNKVDTAETTQNVAAETTQDVAVEPATLVEAETLVEATTQAQDVPNTSAEPSPAVVKRPRGRPRKYPRPDDPATAFPAVPLWPRVEAIADTGPPSPDRTEDEEPPAPSLRRPVGRPRKPPRRADDPPPAPALSVSPKRPVGRPRKHPRPEEESPDAPPAKRPVGRPRKLPSAAELWTAVVGRLVKGKAPLTPELLAEVNSAMDAMELRRHEFSRELLEDGPFDMVALLADLEDNDQYSLGALRDRARRLVEGWRSLMGTEETARGDASNVDVVGP